MPKYEVAYSQIDTYMVTVEADSRDEAVDIVGDMIDSGEIKDYHYDSDGEFTTMKVVE